MTEHPTAPPQNAKDTEFRLLVGARDWQRPDWNGDYYPDDLPSDWQLAYYANDFNAVLLPQSRWRHAAGEWAAWRADAPRGFGFLLEFEGDAEDEGRRCKQALGPAFAGWVGRAPRGEGPPLEMTDFFPALGGSAQIVRFRQADAEDLRAFGRHLVALAARHPPVLALIGDTGVSSETLKQARLAAELSGLG